MERTGTTNLTLHEAKAKLRLTIQHLAEWRIAKGLTHCSPKYRNELRRVAHEYERWSGVRLPGNWRYYSSEDLMTYLKAQAEN